MKSKTSCSEVPVYEMLSFALNEKYMCEEEGVTYYKIPASFLTKGMIRNIEESVQKKLEKRFGNASVKVKSINWNITKYKEEKWKGENTPKTIDDIVGYILYYCNGSFVKNIKNQGFITLRQFECLWKIYLQEKTKRNSYVPTYERDWDISDEECMDMGCYY